MTHLLLRSLLAVAALTVVLASPAQSGAQAEPAHPEDGWRRTADGWEHWPLAARPLVPQGIVTKRDRAYSEPLFPAAVHPAIWAGLQLSLSLVALALFSSPEE